MAISNKSSYWVSAIVLVLLFSIGSDIYLKKEYDSRLNEQEQKAKELQAAYDAQLMALNTLIKNSEEEHQKSIEKVISLVKKTEQESTSKLEELEDELKGISVEAGDFSVVIEDVLKGVVSIITDKSQGSGVIITEDGLVITNYHVIRDASQLSIVSYDKKVYAASLLGVEKLNDLAVLKMSSKEQFHNLNFGDSDKIKIGEKIAAVGNPAGLGSTVTQGIISQKDRKI